MDDVGTAKDRPGVVVAAGVPKRPAEGVVVEAGVPKDNPPDVAAVVYAIPGVPFKKTAPIKILNIKERC